MRERVNITLSLKISPNESGKKNTKRNKKPGAKTKGECRFCVIPEDMISLEERGARKTPNGVSDGMGRGKKNVLLAFRSCTG